MASLNAQERIQRNIFVILVDNLSEIYKKECKECMERTKTRSEFNFTELKKINYVTNVKNVKSDASKSFQVCINFEKVTLINLIYC